MPNKDAIVYYDKIVPDAFHGTSDANAGLILKQNSFRSGNNERSYLGDGVYFFESSIEEARKWATGRFKDEKICVLRATLHLGKCLNLQEFEHQKLVFEVKEKLLKLDIKEEELTDALLINFFARQFDIDSVKAIIVKDRLETFFKGSKFFRHIQVIICMKNMSRIQDIEKIRIN